MTDLKHYHSLLKSGLAKWTNADVQKLVDEVERLQRLVPSAVPDDFKEPGERPVALRDHWACRTRFVGGH